VSTLVDSQKVVVVIPNWNGFDELNACLNSLQAQTITAHIIVIDNGSIDKSVELIESQYPAIELIKHTVNKGYAGGVNPGFKRAIERHDDYVAVFNNDAVADPYWLERLVSCLDTQPNVGIATPKVTSLDGSHLDTTGDYYTVWGLPYPRGRNEADTHQYDTATDIFAASGAASLYRVSVLEKVGLFDEDFFAYYEDIDLSFRAQFAGWKISYVPNSVVHHATSTTGIKIKGFFTYQTMKNLPWLFLKNVPGRYVGIMSIRFSIVYLSFFVSALERHQFLYALRGFGRMLSLVPKKLGERRTIQTSRQVPDEYIWAHILHDLPPNATRLRQLRALWRKALKKPA
jgi:GT2 family glycosyltransferase